MAALMPVEAKTTSGPAPRRADAATPAAVCLKLASGPQAGRLVRLSAARCTLGSAPECTLRLRAAGIEPVHCLIDRTGPQTIIRRVAGVSRVNGQPFESVPLTPGSRLQLAGIEFELVGDERLVLEAAPRVPIAASVPPPAAAEPVVAKGEIEAENKEIETNQLRQELEARLEALQTELGQLGRELVQQAQATPEITQQLTAELTAELSARVQSELSAQVQSQLALAAPGWTSEVSREVMPRVTTSVTADVLTWLESELAAVTERLTTQITGEVAAQVTHEVGGQVQSLMTQAVSGLTSHLEDRLSQLIDAISQHVEEEVGEVTVDMAARLAEKVAESSATMASQITGQVTHDVAARLAGEISWQVAQAMGEQSPVMRRELAEQLASEIKGQVSTELASTLTAQVAQQAASEVTRQISERVEGLPERLATDVTERVRSYVDEQLAASAARAAAERSEADSQRNALQQQHQQTQSEIVSFAKHLEQRLDTMAESQRSREERHRQLEQEVSGLRPAIQEQSEQFASRLTELDQTRQAFVSHQESWQADLRIWQEQTSEQSQQIRQRLDELWNRWETFEREQLERASQESIRMADHSEQIDHRLAEIRAEREAFEQDRQHGPIDRSSSHPGEHARQMDERLAELHATRKAMEAQRHQHWQTSEPPAEEGPPFDETNERVEDTSTPVDEPQAAEVPVSDEQAAPDIESYQPSSTPPVEPSKMFAHLLRDEHEASAERIENEPVAPAAVDRPMRSPEPEPVAPGGTHEDESIEDYMSRLMDRVRGMHTGPSTTSPAASGPQASPRRREEPSPAPVVSQPEPEIQKVKDLSELAPRAAAPELTSNISAMRDLANLSARSAIDTHSRKKMRSVVYGKLMVSFVALAAAAILTWMSGSGGQIAYGAALVSTIVAVIWGVEYLVLSGYTFWRKAVSPKSPAKPEAPPQA